MSLCQVCRQTLPSFPIPNDDRSLVTASLPDISNWSESFFDGQWILTAHFLLHASWESLKTSISNDCPLCWTIWRCIRSSPVASPNDETITNFNAQIFNLACEPNDAAYTLDIRLAGLGLKIKDLRLAVWKTTEKWYLGRSSSDTSQHIMLTDSGQTPRRYFPSLINIHLRPLLNSQNGGSMSAKKSTPAA